MGMEVNGRKLLRQKFGQAFNEPLYAWVVEGRSASHCIWSLARRAVVQMNGTPIANTDGLLHHFTTHTAFQSILGAGELWLTDYRCLNDPNEIRHGLSVAGDTLAEFENELVPEARHLLRSAVGAPLPRHVFVACFSLLCDSPMHWREYAAKEGVAIGFEPSGFRELVAADIRAINLTRVAYELAIKKGLFLTMAVLLDEILRFDLDRGFFNHDAYQAESQQFLAELLPLCKEEKFEPEHEVRLLVVPALSMTQVAAPVRQRERCTSKTIMEFIGTRDLSRDFVLPIAKFVVGPNADDATLHSVREWAGRKGVAVHRSANALPRA